MELKNQEIPATVEPPVKPEVKAFVKKCAKEWCAFHNRDSRHVRVGFAAFAVQRALDTQPAAVAPTMSKEEIEELVRLERYQALGNIMPMGIDHEDLDALRAKLAKMGSGS
jgi:hypothetical protein